MYNTATHRMPHARFELSKINIAWQLNHMCIHTSYHKGIKHKTLKMWEWPEDQDKHSHYFACTIDILYIESVQQ